MDRVDGELNRRMALLAEHPHIHQCSRSKNLGLNRRLADNSAVQRHDREMLQNQKPDVPQPATSRAMAPSRISRCEVSGRQGHRVVQWSAMPAGTNASRHGRVCTGIGILLPGTPGRAGGGEMSTVVSRRNFLCAATATVSLSWGGMRILAAQREAPSAEIGNSLPLATQPFIYGSAFYRPPTRPRPCGEQC